MLRLMYRWILRLHPPFFRGRFAQEMLWMFDLQKGSLARIRLLADGIVSLLRQWMLRPEFRKAPDEYPAPVGIPLSYTSQRMAPRAGALLDGALVSLLTFTMVCLVMQYKWNHPTIMPIVSYYRARPETPRLAPSTQKPVLKPGPPVYVDGGRLFLMVQRPAPSKNLP